MSLAHLVKEVKDIKRLEQVLVALVKNELGFIVDQLKLKHLIPVHVRVQKRKFKQGETNAVRVREAFEELGGAFIKLGQLLSLRPDLVPKEFSQEFRKMQDQVPPFSSRDAKDIVKKELAKGQTRFAYFNPKPIAAASIGQVHEAVLKNGKKAVVKVQRPKIRKQMETDIDILYFLARLLEKHYGKEVFDPTGIVKEFESYTQNELDYVTEARNIDKFHRNFQDTSEVVIPKVYWKYTTDRLLTMEYLHGFKATQLKGMEKRKKERKRVTQQVASLMFQQVFIHGFFHADPHPGNILIMKNHRIGLLDFGIVGSLDQELIHNFSTLFIALIDKDLDTVTEVMMELGVMEDTIDMSALKNDLSSYLGKYYDTPVKEIKVSQLFHSLLDIAKKYHIRMPADFVLLGKALMTVEGFAAELDPEFNLVETARPFVKQLKKRTPQYFLHQGKKSVEKFTRLFTKLPDSINQVLFRAKDMDKSMGKIDWDLKTMTTELDKSSNRMVLGMLILGFLVASALTIDIGESVLIGLPLVSLIGFIISFILVLLLLRSVIKEKRATE